METSDSVFQIQRDAHCTERQRARSSHANLRYSLVPSFQTNICPPEHPVHTATLAYIELSHHPLLAEFYPPGHTTRQIINKISI